MAIEYLTIAHVHMLRDETPGDGGLEGPRQERRQEHRQGGRLRSTVGRGLMSIGSRLAGEGAAGAIRVGPRLTIDGCDQCRP